MAWTVLSMIPQVDLLALLDENAHAVFIVNARRCWHKSRDEQIHAILNAMQEADPLKNVTPKSKQGEILMLMLQHICSCSDFITSYTKDIQFRMSSSSSISLAIT
jgi:hypothetical protein